MIFDDLERKKVNANKKTDLIKEVLKSRTKQDWDFNIFDRTFYTLKAILVVLIGREKHIRYDDSIIVTTFNFHSVYSLDCFNAYEWNELVVGYGYFKNWHYDINSDGNC